MENPILAAQEDICIQLPQKRLPAHMQYEISKDEKLLTLGADRKQELTPRTATNLGEGRYFGGHDGKLLFLMFRSASGDRGCGPLGRDDKKIFGLGS